MTRVEVSVQAVHWGRNLLRPAGLAQARGWLDARLFLGKIVGGGTHEKLPDVYRQ